jgi:hypothetical protein
MPAPHQRQRKPAAQQDQQRADGPRIADAITTRAVGDLIPYASNARTHSPEQIAQIAASIREFGFTNPVLVDADGGIVAGHGRVLAAQKLGLTEVPTIDVGYLTAAQRKAYVLADNKIALNAGWDDELLAIELSGILELGMGVEVIGFSEAELTKLGVGVEATEMPELPSGEKPPFTQMTFTLHDDQAADVIAALAAAKAMGPFGDTGNENSNGNALARVAELFLSKHGAPVADADC